jgi:hypothetical protein
MNGTFDLLWPHICPQQKTHPDLGQALSGRFVDNPKILIGLDAEGKLTFTPTEIVTGSPDVEITTIETPGSGSGGLMELAVV